MRSKSGPPAPEPGSPPSSPPPPLEASPTAELRATRDLAKPELLALVGKSLRALRVRKGYSLERLARASHVSRAMLSQIELAQSAPTITILWRVASALGVPFSALLGSDGPPPATLLRASEAFRLRSAEGGLVSRPLFPFGSGPRRTEFYELTLAPLAEERSSAHPPGTLENLVVAKGKVDIRVGTERYALGQGDALVFRADVEHVYCNQTEREAKLYLVMTYAIELL